jgi:hypothetical protein
MPKLPVLKPRQVIAALEKAGFRQVRRRGAMFNSSGEIYSLPCPTTLGI